jgi:hypothetical protein
VDAEAEAEAATEAGAAAPKDGVPPLPKVKAGAACEAAGGIGVDRVPALDPGGLLPKVNPPKGLAATGALIPEEEEVEAGAALVDVVDQLGALVPAVPPPIPPGRVAVASEVAGALWADMVPAEVLPTPKSVVLLLLLLLPPPLLAAAELAVAPKVKAKALPLPLPLPLVVGLAADVDAAEVAAPKVKAGVGVGEDPSFFGRGSEGALLPLPKVKMGSLLVLLLVVVVDDSAGVVVIVSLAGVELSGGRLLVGSVEVAVEVAAKKCEAGVDSVGAAFGASPKREVVAVVETAGALKLKVGGVAAGTLGVLSPKEKVGTGSEAEGLLSAPVSCPRAFSFFVSFAFSAVSFSFSFSLSFSSFPGSEGATKGATVVVMEPLQLNPPKVEEGVSEGAVVVLLPKVKAGMALGGVAEEAATEKVGRGVLLAESLPLDSPISACCVVAVDFPSPLHALLVVVVVVVVVVPSAAAAAAAVVVALALGLGAWKVKAGRVWEEVKGVFSPFSPFSPPAVEETAESVVVGGVGVVTGSWEGFPVASNRRVGGGRGESEGGSAADRETEVRGGVVFDDPSP